MNGVGMYGRVDRSVYLVSARTVVNVFRPVAPSTSGVCFVFSERQRSRNYGYKVGQQVSVGASRRKVCVNQTQMSDEVNNGGNDNDDDDEDNGSINSKAGSMERRGDRSSRSGSRWTGQNVEWL